jgi:transposase
MIRSSKISLKFSNLGKQEFLNVFIEEYQRIVGRYIDILWDREKISELLPKETTESVATWLSARMRQAAAKQASGIIRGTRQKQKQREFVYKQLIKKGMPRRAKRLKKIIDRQKTSKPNLENVCPELDSRFVKFDWKNKTSFDGWLTLSSIGGKMKLVFPMKKHKHFKKMLGCGKLKTGVRLSATEATFMFEIPEVEKKKKGKTIGIDIGMSNVWSSSQGLQSKPDIHGHTLIEIAQKLGRKRKGSLGFRRAVEHRKNYINWSLNQLNLNGVKTIRREKLRDVRRGKRTSRLLTSFIYPHIFDKIEDLASRSGVQIETVFSPFTSQRCSCCGWVQKSNRHGGVFKCKACGYTANSDLNASINIGLHLTNLGKNWKRLDNRKGFYWPEVCHEPIVRDTPKLNRVG